MILVRVTNTNNPPKELALVRIELVGIDRWMISVVVDRVEDATGVHSRIIDVPPKGNVLNLIKAALNSLDDHILELET